MRRKKKCITQLVSVILSCVDLSIPVDVFIIIIIAIIIMIIKAFFIVVVSVEHCGKLFKMNSEEKKWEENSQSIFDGQNSGI